MSLNIQFTPDIEAKLRERAAAEGKDPTEFAIEAVAEKLAVSNGALSKAAAEARLGAWGQFIAHMHDHAKNLPPNHFIDDSRESIYEDCGG